MVSTFKLNIYKRHLFMFEQEIPTRYFWHQYPGTCISNYFHMYMIWPLANWDDFFISHFFALKHVSRKLFSWLLQLSVVLLTLNLQRGKKLISHVWNMTNSSFILQTYWTSYVTFIWLCSLIVLVTLCLLEWPWSHKGIILSFKQCLSCKLWYFEIGHTIVSYVF
jgi:hypothetical protein